VGDGLAVPADVAGGVVETGPALGWLRRDEVSGTAEVAGWPGDEVPGGKVAS